MTQSSLVILERFIITGFNYNYQEITHFYQLYTFENLTRVTNATFFFPSAPLLLKRGVPRVMRCSDISFRKPLNHFNILALVMGLSGFPTVYKYSCVLAHHTIFVGVVSREFIRFLVNFSREINADIQERCGQ